MMKRITYIYIAISLFTLDHSFAKDEKWLVLNTKKIADGLVTVVKKEKDPNVFNLSKEPVKNFKDEKMAIRFACENMSKANKIKNYHFDFKDSSCSYQFSENNMAQEIMIRGNEFIHITHEPSKKNIDEIMSELKTQIRKGNFI